MAEPERADVFVVVPAFNEAPRIGRVVRRLAPRFVVVVVDDGSSDGTAGEARSAGAWVLRHPLNRGQGAALQTGLRFALDRGARFVVTFDGDGQHSDEEIDRLLEALVTRSCDFALGSRFLGTAENIPWTRRLLLRGAILFTRVTSGLPVSDAHNGLRAMTARGARRIDLRLDRMAHASELLDQVADSGLAWVEVPVTVRYTADSLAKGQRSSDAVRILMDYLLGRWFR